MNRETQIEQWEAHIARHLTALQRIEKDSQESKDSYEKWTAILTLVQIACVIFASVPIACMLYLALWMAL